MFWVRSDISGFYQPKGKTALNFVQNLREESHSWHKRDIIGSMFQDEANIFIKSGDGGDGMISFRREKYVPLGGPDGGDGGRGGHIIFKVNGKLNSLHTIRRAVHYRADRGVHGGRTNKTGANAADLYLEVPAGTLVRDRDTGDLLAELVNIGDEAIIIKGGDGGRGNTKFASSVNRAPHMAERGEPGRELWVSLELKLIADVGLVGLPNAGKSTLLSVISAAKPKIAAYPFTTLVPNLGVVAVGEYDSIVIADIPGLIEGASSGAGLGHTFLRHIERTKVILHLIDGSASDPMENFAAINQELALYDAGLERKPQIVVLTKMDLPDAIAWEPILEEEINKRGYTFMSISAVTRLNLQDLIYKVYQMLEELPEPEVDPNAEEVVIRPDFDENQFTIEREEDAWRVRGIRIERVASMTYFEFDTTVRRFQRILESMGITKALIEAGVEPGDMVRIANEELEWTD